MKSVKISVRKNKSLVTYKKPYRSKNDSNWVENQKLWNEAIMRSKPLNVSRDIELPGNVLGIKNNNICFEVPSGFRTIKYSSAVKYQAVRERSERKMFTLEFPHMVFLGTFGDKLRLSSIMSFFLKDSEKPISSFSDLNERLFIPPMPNTYHSGNMCIPGGNFKSPNNSPSSLISTTMDRYFGAGFNNDYNSGPYGLWNEVPNQTDTLDAFDPSPTWTSFFEEWQNNGVSYIDFARLKKAQSHYSMKELLTIPTPFIQPGLASKTIYSISLVR